MSGALTTHGYLRTCLLCDGPIEPRTQPSEAECRRCGAVNDVVSHVAPLAGTRAPSLPWLDRAAGTAVEPLRPEPKTGLDPYRGAAPDVPRSMRIHWRPRGVLLGTLVLGVLVSPLVWLISPYLLLPLAAVSLLAGAIWALEHYELTTAGGLISLQREGPPRPRLSLRGELDAHGEIVPDPIEPTKATHVAVCRMRLDLSGTDCYGLQLTDDTGRIRRYRLTTNRDRAVIAWRVLYENLPNDDATTRSTEP